MAYCYSGICNRGSMGFIANGKCVFVKKKWEYRKHEGWLHHPDIYMKVCTQCNKEEQITKEEYEKGIKAFKKLRKKISSTSSNNEKIELIDFGMGYGWNFWKYY